MTIIKNRTSEHLTDLLREYIEPGSISISDEQLSYPVVANNLRLEHRILPHNQRFINDIGVYTNHIQNLWSHMKSEIRKKNGVMLSSLPDFIIEFFFRKKFLRNIENDLEKRLFIFVAKYIYPINII